MNRNQQYCRRMILCLLISVMIMVLVGGCNPQKAAQGNIEAVLQQVFSAPDADYCGLPRLAFNDPRMQEEDFRQAFEKEYNDFFQAVLAPYCTEAGLEQVVIIYSQYHLVCDFAGYTIMPDQIESTLDKQLDNGDELFTFSARLIINHPERDEAVLIAQGRARVTAEGLVERLSVGNEEEILRLLMAED